MWKSVAGHNVSMKVSAEADDWETDPDFENDVSEQEQRWGAKTIEGSGRGEHIRNRSTFSPSPSSFFTPELRHKVAAEHEQVKNKEQTPKASYGYGGRFGVERDRMDKVAVGHDYVADFEQHCSQKDAARGFGGRYGVQKDRVDRSALGFEYKGEVQQHASQKDYSKGFGGKYGVEKEKVDRAALGYDYKGETEKHQSQRDYSKGFGGKFGIEKEKVDKSAMGFDYKSETEKHQSQKDYSAGFGGRYGVQTERMDKSAAAFSDMDSPSSAYQKTQPLEASSAGTGNLKARFENLAKASDEENRQRLEEERARRQAREKREQEEASLKQQEQSHREKNHPPPVPDPEDEMTPEMKQHLAGIQEIPEPVEDEPEYDEPPALPPRSDDFLHLDAPPLPHRSAEIEEDDDAEYEEVADPPPAALPAAENDYEDLSGGITALALYDYEGEEEDEISFNPNDIITHIEMVDEGWWKGRCHGRVGLFPAAYVKVEE